jgi:hypothetical protein
LDSGIKKEIKLGISSYNYGVLTSGSQTFHTVTDKNGESGFGTQPCETSVAAKHTKNNVCDTVAGDGP